MVKAVWIALALLGSIASLDSTVVAAVQSARSPALDAVGRGVTSLGTPKTALALVLAIAVIEPLEGVTVARLAMASAIPANLVVEVLKRTVRRVRPDGNPDPVNSSFPSSHAANAVVLAAVLARRWRKWRVAFWIVAAIVAAFRVVANRHYPSDVVAGAAIGLASAWAAARWAGPWLVRIAPGRATWLRDGSRDARSGI
jgi:undecaprenyl-diphosphatase